MKTAIISDVHDNLHNMRLALEEIKDRNIENVMFLGDFIAPSTAEELFKSGLKVTAIFGNNDGDRANIMKKSFDYSKVTLSNNEWMSTEIEEKNVFLTHYPEVAKPVAKSGDYDAVFFGHNHLVSVENLKNGTLLANPGEIAASKTGKATFLVWNAKENDAAVVELNEVISANK